MGKNKTMALKHKKAREMACLEYKRQALAESMNDVAEGKLTFCTDSMHMSKKRISCKLRAGTPHKKASRILLDYYADRL